MVGRVDSTSVFWCASLVGYGTYAMQPCLACVTQCNELQQHNDASKLAEVDTALTQPTHSMEDTTVQDCAQDSKGHACQDLQRPCRAGCGGIKPLFIPVYRERPRGGGSEVAVRSMSVLA